MKEENEGRPMNQVIKIDEARIRDHLGEMVRGAVEETLNALLDAEADELCGAGRYQRSAERVDTRAGSYDRIAEQGRRGQVAGPEAAAAGFRDGHHRAVSAAGDPSQDSRGRGICGWAVLSQSCCCQAPAHRRDPVVNQALHEHAASVSGRTNRNRSQRRLKKCAKDSGHYR